MSTVEKMWGANSKTSVNLRNLATASFSERVAAKNTQHNIQIGGMVKN